MIKKILQAIEGDDLIQAGMHIQELETEGLKLDLEGYFGAFVSWEI